MSRIPVGILGATGAVGQRFIELLAHHPWFEITALAASERSVGKKFSHAARWLLSTPLPQDIANIVVQKPDNSLKPKILFSALDSSVAGEIESDLAAQGYTIISNARNHRMSANVPLIIPEVNSSHLDLLKLQTHGKIICVPNCSTVGLAMALKPIYDRFGIDQLQVVTMQAISGAGYPGVASLDIMDNVIPFISGEEEKMETETLKILGSSSTPAKIRISAQCNRVAVTDGHTECVSLKLTNPATQDEMLETWQNFPGLDLPLAPSLPIWVHTEERFPQPKLHRHQDKAMAVHVGRLRACNVFDYKFTLMSHNTIRGAAGGGVLIAELLHSKNLL